MNVIRQNAEATPEAIAKAAEVTRLSRRMVGLTAIGEHDAAGSYETRLLRSKAEYAIIVDRYVIEQSRVKSVA